MTSKATNIRTIKVPSKLRFNIVEEKDDSLVIYCNPRMEDRNFDVGVKFDATVLDAMTPRQAIAAFVVYLNKDWEIL